jgi:hypothetical protein
VPRGVVPRGVVCAWPAAGQALRPCGAACIVCVGMQSIGEMREEFSSSASHPWGWQRLWRLCCPPGTRGAALMRPAATRKRGAPAAQRLLPGCE